MELCFINKKKYIYIYKIYIHKIINNNINNIKTCLFIVKSK